MISSRAYQPQRSAFPMAVALSLSLHLLLVLTFPHPGVEPFTPEPEELIAVELDEPAQRVVAPIKAAEPEKELERGEDAAKPDEQAAQAEKLTGEELTALDQAVRGGVSGRFRVPAASRIPVSLPRRDRERPAINADELTVPVELPPVALSPSAGEVEARTTPSRGQTTPAVADMGGAGAAASELLAGLKKPAPLVELEPLPGDREGARRENRSPGAPEIGGDVGRDRQVLLRPEPPRVEIVNPVTVEMEFWVSPAGDVTRVQPLRTGEATLDRAAARYVKGFKFNALPDASMGEQRGTIRVRFSLR